MNIYFPSCRTEKKKRQRRVDKEGGPLVAFPNIDFIQLQHGKESGCCSARRLLVQDDPDPSQQTNVASICLSWGSASMT